MNRITLILLCGFTLLVNLEGRSIAKQLGPAIVVSPNPETYVDPVLANLPTVMDNFFIPPYYPGSTPYLNQIWYTSNAFIVNRLIINPLNDKIMHIAIGENVIFDDTGVFRTMIPSNTLATSRDGGKTWKYGPPVEQTIPLGGTISQLVNASLGPGLALVYTKFGKLYAFGNGYFDLRANPPNTVPTTGFLLTHSDDKGRTWSPIEKVVVSDQDWWYFPQTRFSRGVGPREFYINPDPAHPHIIHGVTNFNLIPHNFYSTIYYSVSKDGGKTFPPFKEIYNMREDPVWVEKYFDSYASPFFRRQALTFTKGGFCFASGPPFFVDDTTVLIPLFRGWITRGTVFSDINDEKTIRQDIAFARSEDGGKTWEKVAGATDSFMGNTLNVYDPGFINISIPKIINGIRSFGDFFESYIGSAPALQSNSPAVSPFTGRIYACYPANNPAFGMRKPEFIPTANCILLSTSADKGKTFSPAVKINRTPIDIQMGAQQAFNQNMLMTDDGHIVVVYNDFRNWTGEPGELKGDGFDNTTANMPPLQTDAWMAIYKEVDDPKGGSTGVGLDFVEEIRLTEESYDTRLAYQGFKSTIFATGTPEGIILTLNNSNVVHVVYSVSVPSNGSVNHNSYKGMSVNTNSFFEIRMKRLQFPKPSDQ